MTKNKLNKYKLVEDYRVQLPVGFNRDGVVFREVVLDEWRGIDKAMLSKPAFKKNPVKGLTEIIRRLLQEIPGIMDAKSNKMALCSRHFVENMYQADRDFILVQALILAGENEKELAFQCENCNAELIEDIVLLDCDVFELGDKDPTINFSVPYGYDYVDSQGNNKKVKDFTYTLPTVKTYEKLAKYQNQGEIAFMHKLLAEQVTYNDGESFPVEVLEMGKGKDLKVMSNVLGELLPGVDLTSKTCCDQCDHEMEVAIDLTHFFL